MVTKGSKLVQGKGDMDANKFLLSQMDLLEKIKPTLGTDHTKEKGFEICKNFALNTFGKADEQDRDGCADKVTAKIFYTYI